MYKSPTTKSKQWQKTVSKYCLKNSCKRLENKIVMRNVNYFRNSHPITTHVYLNPTNRILPT